MARLDIKTLVLAFENRIVALEKNPPDKVPTSVVLSLLENAIDEVIRNHFKDQIKEDFKQIINEELKNHRDEYIDSIVKDLFDDEELKQIIKSNLKTRIMQSIEK